MSRRRGNSEARPPAGRPSAEASEARERARRSLADAVSRRPVVDALIDVLAGVQQKNHIAERLRLQWLEGRGRAT